VTKIEPKKRGRPSVDKFFQIDSLIIFCALNEARASTATPTEIVCRIVNSLWRGDPEYLPYIIEIFPSPAPEKIFAPTIAAVRLQLGAGAKSVAARVLSRLRKSVVRKNKERFAVLDPAFVDPAHQWSSIFQFDSRRGRRTGFK
jgi:hypothetical protein